MRTSRQKDLILEIINNSFDHLTADGVYKKARQKLPNISLGTVYRNLNQLVDMKLIRRINLKEKDHFDAIRGHHNHFICNKCNQIIDVESDFSIDDTFIQDNLISYYEVNYFGTCKKCLEKEI